MDRELRQLVSERRILRTIKVFCKDDYHDDGDGCNMVERDLDGNQGGAEVINGSRAGSEYNLHLL